MIKFDRSIDEFYYAENQVFEKIRQEAKQLLNAHDTQKKEIQTIAEFNNYKVKTRENFLKSIGGLPNSEVALDIRETGQLKRNGYRIRKIVYQSSPGFYVPANLYVPENINTKVPGVLMACGHSKEGKAAPLYQQVCIDLVRSGFVVLIIDSPAQGELQQYYDLVSNQSRFNDRTHEHSYMQLQCTLLGHNIARYFIFDGIRGIDVLTSLPEVDKERIGVTGNSGGGTLTQYLMMADARVKAAMPCCSISSRESYLATGTRSYDGEQLLASAISQGLDCDDFISCFAPRPVRIGAAAYDFFCIEGVLETYRKSKDVYSLFNAEDKLSMIVGKHTHGYSAELRQGCVNWFKQQLQGVTPDFLTLDPEVEDPANLSCTESGHISGMFPQGSTIFDLNLAQWKKQQNKSDISSAKIAAALGIKRSNEVIYPRIISSTLEDEMVAEKVFFFSEPDISLTGVIYKPQETLPESATMMLIPDGTEGQESEQQLIKSIVGNNGLVMILDLRGTGAVKLREMTDRPSHLNKGTEFRLTSDLFMLGTSMLAKRTFDVLRGYDYLRSRDDLKSIKKINVYGRGNEAVYSLYAAAIEGNFGSIVLKDMLCSYDDLLKTMHYNEDICVNSIIAPGIVNHFDLADILVYLGKRSLRLPTVVNACGDVFSTAEFSYEIATTLNISEQNLASFIIDDDTKTIADYLCSSY